MDLDSWSLDPEVFLKIDLTRGFCLCIGLGPSIIKNLEVYLFQVLKKFVPDPETSWTRKFSITLGHLVCSLKGPYAATLGEASTGTCGDFVFYFSEASHYRVPVLHSAFCRKPLSVLEGAGVGENPSARLTLFSTSRET